jgi:hypothetical protein
LFDYRGIARDAIPSAVAQVFDVDVSAETSVVGQIPAIVVGVFVDDNVVAGPVPVRAIGQIERAYAEVEPAEPEARGATAGEMPDVAGTEAGGETAVRPGMIEMEAWIIFGVFVADPFAIGVNVRRFRMARFVGEFGRTRRGRVRSRANRRRTVFRDVTAANFVVLLRENRKRKDEAECKKLEK